MMPSRTQPPRCWHCLRRGHVRQAVGRNGLIVVAVGGAHPKAAPLPAAKALLAHEPRDPIATVSLTGLLQRLPDPRRAIGLAALLMDLANLLLEVLVFLGTAARVLLAFVPVVIATGRNFKHPAESSDGMFSFQGVDPLVALLCGSERIPKVFFKMSRCWRKWAFSRRKAASSPSIWLWLIGLAGA